MADVLTNTRPTPKPRAVAVSLASGWHNVRMYWTQTVPGMERPLGEIVRFISKSDLERARLIREARAIYESIFPPVAPVSEPRNPKR
jgi:hypothetical protein